MSEHVGLRLITKGMLIAAFASLQFFFVCGQAFANSTILRVGFPVAAATGGYPFGRDDGGGLRFSFYDGLTRFSPTGELQSALADSWQNETPTTWVFQLKEGVVFSNGEPFDAHSVVATLTELYNPGVLHPKKADMGAISGYRARARYTVEIVTSEPDPLVPNRMAQLPMIEPKAWASMGKDAYARTPIGTGPYTVESWGPNNTKPVLVVAETSWRKVKHITRVEMTVIPDPGTRVGGLLSEELDMAISLASDDIAMLEANDITVQMTTNPSILSIAFVTVRNDESPIKNARVRQALNYAVDKQSIADFILGGTSRVAHQPSTPELIGYNPEAEPFYYNPEKAKQLLAEAGYPDGFPLKFYVYGGVLPGDTLIFQKLAQDLAAIGVKVELRQISFPDYVRRLFNADWEGIDGFSMGWLNMQLWDPQKSFEQFSCMYSAPFFCDESMMTLIDGARTEMDAVKRESLLKNIVLRFRDQAPALWLVEFAGANGLQPNYKVGLFRLDGSVYEQIEYIGD